MDDAHVLFEFFKEGEVDEKEIEGVFFKTKKHAFQGGGWS